MQPIKYEKTPLFILKTKKISITRTVEKKSSVHKCFVSTYVKNVMSPQRIVLCDLKGKMRKYEKRTHFFDRGLVLKNLA